MSDVKVLARWDGWCDPCEIERPLVLTETGERGLRAWLRGNAAEDRHLTLTCAVCGEWQAVPHDEEDVPDRAAPPSALTALRPLGQRQVVVRSAVPAVSPDAYPADTVVDTVAQPRATRQLPDRSLDLVAEGFDLIGLAS